MPTPTKYTYSISQDLPDGEVNTSKLKTEIQNSSISIALDRIDTTGDVLDIWFKDALLSPEKSILDGDTSDPAGGLLANHDNSPYPDEATPVVLSHKLTPDNRLRVAIEKSDSTSLDIFTHNWCDKTTWYQDSARVEDEIASNTGNNINYTLSNQYIIDTYHGKITLEDDLRDALGQSYRVVVKVNDVLQTEQDPHYGNGGDFVVNYANGEIVFTSALQPADEVKVTYYYARSSQFVVRPSEGTTLSIDMAEVQFSLDVGITDTVVFETFGFVDVFAPQLVGNPYPSGTKIPIKAFKYKTMNDYHNAAFKSYPAYPASGGNSWRGQQVDVVVYDWDYQRSMPLHSLYGMEVKLYLEHDEPFTGTYATATLYCGVD